MLDVLLFIALVCNTYGYTQATNGNVSVITLCTPPTKPIPENGKEAYDQRFVEKSGKVLILKLDNCPTV